MADWSMEGGYVAQDGIGQLRLPAGWRIEWIEGEDPSDPGVEGHFRPECGPIFKRDFAYRIHGGSVALVVHNNDASHHFWLYTRVPVTAGKTYRFGMWGHVWTGGRGCDPRKSEGDRYQYGVRIGMGLRGQTDFGDEIVWGDWHAQNIWDVYHHLQIDGVAQAAYVTCILEAICKWRSHHNDVYLDEASFEDLSGGGDVPVPPAEAEINRVLLKGILKWAEAMNVR